METERKFTYLKNHETKIFNGDNPKENEAFFKAIEATKTDDKKWIESNKESIAYFRKSLYKHSEILTCEVKSKKEAHHLKALVYNRLKALQEFRTSDEFSKEYDRLILFAETLILEIDAKIMNLPDNGITQPNSKHLLKPNDTQPKEKNNFTALQWGAIFFYADITKLLPTNNIQNKLKAFKEKHSINHTYKYFRIQYYEAMKQINDHNNYPIEKLEAIIPFLEQNYKNTIVKVKNDIDFLKEEIV